MVLPFSVIQKNRRWIRGRKSKCSPRKLSSFPVFIRIDENLRDIIESEAKSYERYNDTILRLLCEKKDRIEKLDRLNQELLLKIEHYRVLTKDKGNEWNE
jgi:hypothetical protein